MSFALFYGDICMDLDSVDSDEALNASSFQFLSSVKRFIATIFVSVLNASSALLFYRKISFNASSPLLFRRNSPLNASSTLLFKVTLPTSASDLPKHPLFVALLLNPRPIKDLPSITVPFPTRLTNPHAWLGGVSATSPGRGRPDQ
jgi:hypothetical protein